MYFILGVDDQSFYWNQGTSEVIRVNNRYPDAPWEIVGHAENQCEAKDVVMQWL